MPIYFINLLPTSLLYISILLVCERERDRKRERERVVTINLVNSNASQTKCVRVCVCECVCVFVCVCVCVCVVTIYLVNGNASQTKQGPPCRRKTKTLKTHCHNPSIFSISKHCRERKREKKKAYGGRCRVVAARNEHMSNTIDKALLSFFKAFRNTLATH